MAVDATGLVEDNAGVPALASPEPDRTGAGRWRFGAAARHSLALTVACLVSYWLTSDVLSKVHSLSAADDAVGGLWAVIATIFVYRETHRQSLAAALTRASATLFSFALCLIYLLFFGFHPVGLAVVVGVGTFGLMAIVRGEDVVTAGVTSAIILVLAGLTPRSAWEEPILRVVDTAVGIGVGIVASWAGLRLAARFSH